MRKIFISILTISILLAFVGSAAAQEPDYDRVNEIAQDLNCPTCVGINLADCRTLTCEQWRAQIGDLLTEGYSEQEILDYFSNRYGTQVLQSPPKSGTTLALWILPVAALLIGGGWLFYTVRNWAREAPGAAASPSSPVNATTSQATPQAGSEDYLTQVERDLGID